MEGESLPERTYNHIAFKIDESEIDEFVDKIHKAGVDNHLFELHTGTLHERLARYSRSK